MNIGKKTIHALLLTFSLALFMGATSSYAFTVKDGENVIESPDESRWFEREGILLDGRLVVVNFFDGRKADTGLSVELSASDLKNSQDVAPFTGEIRFYVFIHNTSVFAELTKEDDAFLLKDSTSTLMVTGSDILQSDVTGGDYNIAEGTLNIYVDDSAENNDTAFVVSTFLNAYHNIYEAMLVKYKPVEAPPAEDADSPAAGEPAAEETEESKNEAPAETPTEVPVETPAPQVTEPATETVEPAGEVKEDSTTVKKEAKVTIPADTEDKESEADTASVQLAKAEDSSSRKRTETTIMGEELKHKVSVDIPAGIDERTVSKFQKQISEAIDGLLQEIESNPSAVQERVSYQTYQNIENALSEGKVISAEVVVESVDEKFIP
ncbi:MAG: hypothetical protein IKZ39_03850, partial [Lachnospiraceae bacterium]|nr:hypothetical protein [Lachnospiraceae bacterium]